MHPDVISIVTAYAWWSGIIINYTSKTFKDNISGCKTVIST